MKPAVGIVLAWVLSPPLACGGNAVPVRAPSSAPGAVAPTAAMAAMPALVPTNAPSEDDAQVPVSQHNPSWGSRTALVTIVEYADFQCPFCARVEATLARIRETYGSETVRIVWKNAPIPFHRNARAAAEAGTGVFAMAGGDAFWRFHHGVLHERGPLDPQFLERMAQDAGVQDVAAFRDGLANHQWADTVDRDMSEGEALGVFATPTFFINGEPLAGALPFPTFQGVIERQIRAARAKLDGGTPPERLYVELTNDNRAESGVRDDYNRDEADAAEMK